MTLIIFAALLSGALFLFSISFLVEKRKLWKDEILQGVTGVKDWRLRLNDKTERFVALASNPLLQRAASKSDDLNLIAFSGQTLITYKQIKELYISLSYAYNSGSRAVQQAEAMFKGHGPLKLVTIRRAGKLAEQGIEIKEINSAYYASIVAPPRYAPKPPVYQLEYILSLCDKLTAEIESRLRLIADGPSKVAARLATADAALATASKRFNSLSEAGSDYQPLAARLEAILLVRQRVETTALTDSLGAIPVCNDLDKAIQALAQEAEQAIKQWNNIVAGDKEQVEIVDRMAKVRSTRISCPWSDDNGEPVSWTLAAPDSNPDEQIARSKALLLQARASLASGKPASTEGECKQAKDARTQADRMVNAYINAKASVDEQVPKVRAELAAIRGELSGITDGESTHEMFHLIARTCAAVEGRISEVHSLYVKEQFTQALTLLTSTVGNEYGLPIAKLLSQAKDILNRAKELLALLKQASQVTNTLKAE